MISFYRSMILSFIFLKLLSFSLSTFSSDVSYFLLAVPNGSTIGNLTFSPGGRKQMLPVGIPSLQPDDIERTPVTGLVNNIHAILLSLARFGMLADAYRLLSSI
eukprot:GHVS01065752.1.p2 GENE.GHVS01065752.1~~GHVS01065752.1.p2  ORF type:complete len:104 (-),score=10.55 GHVS01065752.1:405-716(-)